MKSNHKAVKLRIKQLDMRALKLSDFLEKTGSGSQGLSNNLQKYWLLNINTYG